MSAPWPAGCGWFSLDRTRLRLRPEQVRPDRFSMWCWLFGHTLSCCPDHAVYVRDLDGHLVGMLCPRCGGLDGPRG